eukprot:TRINITY_DN34141_c0_g1_i1.p1 TRINITY_DN34141_c0_g1~~TRINITY_DN34141_c0_g1_i1.p1  ORF type:complete len:465 (-),score=59.89 TRINITY_DN34141_c0_g1_i1:167-1537(-)
MASALSWHAFFLCSVALSLVLLLVSNMLYISQRSDLPNNLQLERSIELLQQQSHNLELKNQHLMRMLEHLKRRQKIFQSQEKKGKGQKMTEQILNKTVDEEIARRIAKIPSYIVPTLVKQRVLWTLSPSSTDRWSCGAKSSVITHDMALYQAFAQSYIGDERQTVNSVNNVFEIFGSKRLKDKVFLDVGFLKVGLESVWVRGFNAEVYITNVLLPLWVPKVHGQHFDEMHNLIKSRAEAGEYGSDFDVERGFEYAKQCGKSTHGIHVLATAPEVLEGVPKGSVDASYSDDVLNVTSDAKAFFQSLAKVHRNGSLTCHKLKMASGDILLTPKGKFNAKAASSLGHRYFVEGNRLRLSGVVKAAAEASFEIVHLRREVQPFSTEGSRDTEAYWNKLSALDPIKHEKWDRSDFHGCTSTNMPMTGALICFRFRRGGSPRNSETPPCGQDEWTKSDFSFN